MDTADYQAKLKALGVDRGKLESGFKYDGPWTAPPAPAEKPNDCNRGPTSAAHPAPSEKPNASTAHLKTARNPADVVDLQREPAPAARKPTKYCRCGVAISNAATRCRKCFFQDRRGKPRNTWPSASQGFSLPARPSPPPAPAPPAEAEPVVFWHVLGQPEIEKIAIAVITGNGGVAHEDDIMAAVEELTRNQVGSMICTLVLDGSIKISCHNKEVLYHGPGYVGIDWDYVI